MVKKLTIFLILVLAGLATFLAGYLFSRNATNDLAQPALIDNSLVSRFQKTEEKRAAPTGVFQVSRDEANFPVLVAGGKEILYYNSKNGEIRSAATDDLSGGTTLVSKILPGAAQVNWATNKTLVAIYGSGTIYYDLNSGFSKKLDLKIKNPAISKPGNAIAYNYFDDNEGTGKISVSDPKLEVFKNVMPTRFGSWQISWVNDHELSLVKPPTDSSAPGYWLFAFDTENKQLENMLQSKDGLKILWSPDGQKLIYSYTDPSTQKDSLYLMTMANKEEVNLSLDAKASSCVWSIDNKTVYCAADQSFISLDTSAPDQAPVQVGGSADVSAAAGNATNLILTSTENYLIFTNTRDGKLYGLSLSK